MMSDKTKERRCQFCGKLLVNETMPFCRRCKLEGRNKVWQIGGIAAGMFTVVHRAKALVGDAKNNGSNSV